MRDGAERKGGGGGAVAGGAGEGNGWGVEAGAPAAERSGRPARGGQRVAFFDLDGTLLAEDTQLLFCNYVLKRHPLRRLFLPFFLPFVPAAVTKLLETREMKRIFLSYLWLSPRQRVLEYAREFAREDVLPRLYPEVRAEVERHKGEGRALVLNSASPLFYVREIGAALGFDHVFGTRVMLHEFQPLVADIDGLNNKHEAKLPAMRAAGLLPCLREESWAYSDSAADLPMLGLADNVVLVNPRPRLTRIGEEKGWRILRPPRPWRTRRGQVDAIVRQVLGIYDDPEVEPAGDEW